MNRGKRPSTRALLALVSLAALLLLATACSNPANSSSQGGVDQGVTAEGHPYKGNLNAPVVIQDFSDFQ
ncbi:MAG: hypothetical protein GX605_09090 [Chloroflexi bacterium]|nr:hypothetical protein [Chloroflexota bacterium]